MNLPDIGIELAPGHHFPCFTLPISLFVKVRCEKTYLTVTTHTSKNPTYELTHKERQKASFRAGLLFSVRESKKTPEKADGSVLVKHEGKVIALYSVAVFYDLSVNAETFP